MNKCVKFLLSFFKKADTFGGSWKRVSYLLVIGTGLQSHSTFAQFYSCGKDKVLVCHKGKNTLCISENALQAHLNHGDHLGSCTGSECGVTAMGGEINCTYSSVTLSAISNTAGVSYQWTGPGNFTSTLSTPTVNHPGIYVISVNDVAGGCTASDTAIVTQNTEPPAGVNISASEMLTCKVNSVKLNGYSTTAGVSYSWTGPLGFISTAQNPRTSQSGLYSLLVKNPANGCISNVNITITQDTASATGVDASVSGALTCAVSSVTLKGTSTSNGVSYVWNGPNGFNAANQSTIVSMPGNYILRVTKPGNNCSVYRVVKVLQNNAVPESVTASASDVLGTNGTVMLTGSSTTPGVNYAWRGPGGYTSSIRAPSVNLPGTYSLTVNNINNGCSAIAAVDVN
jgi:hypothetical protein